MKSFLRFHRKAVKLWRRLPPPLQSPELLDLMLEGLAGDLADFPARPARTRAARLIDYAVNASALILLKELGRVSDQRLQSLRVDRSDVLSRVWSRFFEGARPHDVQYHSFRPLMGAYVKYTILVIVKERRKGCHVLEIDVPAIAISDDDMERAERIRLALSMLAPGDAVVIEQLGQGMKPAEIAAATEISPPAARKRVHRARSRLVDLLARCDIFLS